MKLLNPKSLLCQGMLALALLLGVANAEALSLVPAKSTQNSAGQSTATSATPSAPQTNLTPTAPASSPNSSLGEDIRDIRQPRHLTQPWFWLGIAVGVAALLGAGLAFWRWVRHGKIFVMLPYEIALQGLDEAGRLRNPDQAREYCFEVSSVIRRYIESQFEFQAPQLTTEEFLGNLVNTPEALLTPHRRALAEFLQHCDLAKFAGWRYGHPELEAMHHSAVEFVRQTAAANSGAKQQSPSPTPPPTTANLPADRMHNAIPAVQP